LANRSTRKVIGGSQLGGAPELVVHRRVGQVETPPLGDDGGAQFGGGVVQDHHVHAVAMGRADQLRGRPERQAVPGRAIGEPRGAEHETYVHVALGVRGAACVTPEQVRRRDALRLVGRETLGQTIRGAVHNGAM
jgi:hypothetical protein